MPFNVRPRRPKSAAVEKELPNCHSRGQSPACGHVPVGRLVELEEEAPLGALVGIAHQRAPPATATAVAILPIVAVARVAVARLEELADRDDDGNDNYKVIPGASLEDFFLENIQKIDGKILERQGGMAAHCRERRES